VVSNIKNESNQGNISYTGYSQHSRRYFGENQKFRIALLEKAKRLEKII